MEAGIAKAQPNINHFAELLNQIVVALILLAYVSLLFYILLINWKLPVLDPPNSGVSWFTTFSGSSTTALNGFHKVLLPIITAWSAFAFRTKLSFAFTAVICAALLVSIGVAIYMDTVFRTTAVIEAFNGVPIELAKLPLVSDYFTRSEETLLTYLSLILGLKGAQIVNKGE